MRRYRKRYCDEVHITYSNIYFSLFISFTVKDIIRFTVKDTVQRGSFSEDIFGVSYQSKTIAISTYQIKTVYSISVNSSRRISQLESANRTTGVDHIADWSRLLLNNRYPDGIYTSFVCQFMLCRTSAIHRFIVHRLY